MQLLFSFRHFAFLLRTAPFLGEAREIYAMFVAGQLFSGG
jgi:hypothetical protein